MRKTSLASQIAAKQNSFKLRKLANALLLASFLGACSSDDIEEITEEPVTSPPVVETPDTGPGSEACTAVETALQTTDSGIEYLVTPESCFDNLPEYDFDANFVSLDGLRMHYVDEGPADGEVVLMLHGQPSWSYLYRKMIPILADAGYRVIAPDNMGMGKSDKPTDVSFHQYDTHVALTKAFINQLQLVNINLFVQDWGSLIGLRVAGEMSERFSRVVIANGDLLLFPPNGNPYQYPELEIDETLPDASTFFASKSEDPIDGFQQWIDYAASADNWLAGDVVQSLTEITLSDEETAAYNAPYPDMNYKAAIRAFPAMITDIAIQGIKAWQTLGAYHNPFMINAGEHDEGFGSVEHQQKWISHVPGADGNEHRRFNAGHFIQDDVGEDLALHLLDFLQTTTIEEPLVAGGSQYNFRYCEIILAYMNAGQITAEVWGTPGAGFCPQAQWEALDFDAIAAENGAMAAIENGPRFFVVDETIAGDTVGVSDDDEYQQFGGINMRLLTTADLTASAGQQTYVPGEVSRNNTWVYHPGRRIYELTDSEGNVYVMQSFSRITDATLQMDDLKNLGDRLSLPAGWSYSSRIVESGLQLTPADGVAMVIQDDMGNSYQLAQ